MKKVFKLLLCLIVLICGVVFLNISAKAAETTQNNTFSYYSNDSWKNFSGNAFDTTISCIRIQTPSNGSYYLQYRTQNSGKDNFYPYVKSNDTSAEAYAGYEPRPIQKLQIQVYDNSGNKLYKNIVVMYRTMTDGGWLPWVSNANPEWMQAVQTNYSLGGSLDTSSAYAGVTGKNITGVEVRIFEEQSSEISYTPVGNYKIIDAPFISQLPSYPTGCESVSTVMALNYYGINITVDNFIDNYLYKTDTIFDPNISFGGNPRVGGYGCYAPVIKNAVDEAIIGLDYHSYIPKNKSVMQLCTDYIDNDIPVIFWATINMNTPQNGNAWMYDGRSITWIKPEHCLLLVGYDDNKYIFNDPMKNSAVTYYDRAAVEAAYTGLYSQAVVILEGADSMSASEPFSDVRAGETGADVLWIQQNLNRFGYNLMQNGVFNVETDSAVKDFQKTAGLTVDGIVGRNTIRTLKFDAVMGDANLDGVVDIRDIIRVKHYICGNEQIGINMKNCDFFGNGTINGADLVRMKKIIIGA